MAFKKLKYWFDRELAILLSEKIINVKSDFEKDKFIQIIDQNVQNLELKDRVEVIADALHHHLTTSYTQNIDILIQTLGQENESETGMFTNYYWIMPIAKYVEKYGLEDFEVSMNAISEITKRNTGEYAIRPYLELYTQQTLAVMRLWSKDDNRHLRRLSSEGLRPRLPWAKKMDMFVQNPKLIIPILNNLKDDSSKYVQKSVANCLNDILKDNFKIGQELINKWSIDATKERQWIIKHALRNLLKTQNEWAMQIVD